jgi:hypothetical protein
MHRPLAAQNNVKKLTLLNIRVLIVRGLKVRLGRSLTPIVALGVITGGSSIAPAIAHNVEVAEDVAATFHIEPNHNPRTGEPSRAWFALTRKGGALIPLQECDCTLQIFADSSQAKAMPALQPRLQAIQAESYQNIPGADIVFPKAGIYTLQLNGKPKAEGSFQPFTFRYSVTVAAGTASPPISSSPISPSPIAKQSSPVEPSASTPAPTSSFPQWIPWAILSAAGGIAIGIIATRKR